MNPVAPLPAHPSEDPRIGRFQIAGLIVAASVAGALLLASLDGKGLTVQGVFGYAVLLGIAMAVITWVWRDLLPSRGPQKVLFLAMAALALRLGVGLLLARTLPVAGYDEKAQKAGYVFWDAYKRDGDAWQRGRGDQPLLASFLSPKSSDQYGGLLSISAATYRYLSGDVHRPLMVVVLAAAASALGLLFIWGFAHEGLGPTAGVGAAWIVLLMPEAVLLGASQMREPFLIAGVAMALYGYVVVGSQGPRRGVPWILLGIGALIFFSPLTALAGAAVLAFLALWQGRRRPRIPSWVWWAAAVFAVGGVLLAIQSWARLEQLSGSFSSVLIQWWENAGADWRVRQAAQESDHLEVMLDRLPQAARLPFLVIYGLLQPSLPAAIAAPGVALWKSIAILRGTGWFLILPALVYGTLVAPRRASWRSLEVYLAVLVWVSALLASYRAPGYQWDNPRYRIVLLVAQAGLAGWVWASARARRDVWLGRAYVAASLATGLLLWWYLGRYAGIPSLGLEGTLLAVVVGTLGYLGGAWSYDRRRARASPGAENPPGV